MKRLILPLLLLFSCGIFASELRTFELQHRSAEELIPILRPLVDAGGAISGTGYTLIIRSSEENLTQIEQAIEQLDQAPRMLMISVDQGLDSQRSGNGASVSGTPEKPRVRIYSTRRRNDEGSAQQLQVMEGRWATIRAGQAIPQVTLHTRPSGDVEQGIEYRDVDTGFEVRPQVRGERVILEVRPFRAAPSRRGAGVIEQQEISTTVSGRLGEWIELGGVSEQHEESGVGTIYSTRERGQLTRDVRIKVELVGP